MKNANVIALLCLALAAATLCVYGPALRHDFLALHDDNFYVTANPHVKQGLSVESLRWAWTAYHAANWHPLTWMSHMLDVELYGLEPAGHHATSVSFHVANTVLLFLVLRAMTVATWPSALTAALFALHPLHVESVAWVAERKDVLSGFMFMLTLAAYARYARTPSFGRYGLVVFTGALGLTAKPMLVTLPLVLLVIDFWPLDRLASTAGRRRWRIVAEKVPLLILSAGVGLVTWLAQQQAGAMGSLARFPLQARIANALVACVAYLGKTLLPRNLAAIYPHPGDTIALWKVLASLLLLILVTAAAWAWRRSRPCMMAGWLWYLIMLAPVLGIVQVGEQAMADRYTYLPLIGPFAALSWGLAAVVRRSGRAFAARTVAGAAAAVLLFVLAVLSARQVSTWRDAATVFQRAIHAVPGNYFAHHEYGMLLLKQGEPFQGLAHLKQAVKVRPDWGPGHNTLAWIYASAGLAEAARLHVELARKHGYEPSQSLIRKLQELAQPSDQGSAIPPSALDAQGAGALNTVP